MKNFVSDLLNLRCRAYNFKIVFWGKDSEGNLTKIVKEIDNLDQCDLEVNNYKSLKLFSFDVIPFIDRASYFMEQDFNMCIKAKVILNVRYEEE